MITTIKPIVKWIGGKNKIMNKIIDKLPPKFNNYYEPFVGGGSVFLSIPYTEKAYINDFNKDLINIYKLIKNDYDGLYKALKSLETKYNKSKNMETKKVLFMENRNKFNKIKEKEGISRAALYIFLNKTCFNGFMIENLNGDTNPSFGFHEKVTIANKENMDGFSKKLNKSVTISNKDYKVFLTNVKKGDFVYLDPPYVPDDITNHNYKYNSSKSWSLDDFNDFFDVVDSLDKLGAYIMMSNSYSKLIRKHYKNKKYNMYKIPISRTVSVKKSTRGVKYEVIITNYNNDVTQTKKIKKSRCNKTRKQ
jgi:DNA adenine methylase